MIATADGRATIAGRTAPLAERADYEIFLALRQRVDAVMVGAETYGSRATGRWRSSPRRLALGRAAGRPRSARARARPRDDRHAVARPRAAAVCGDVSYLREATSRSALRRLPTSTAWPRSTARAAPGSTRRSCPPGLVDVLHLVIAPKLARARPADDPHRRHARPAADLALLSVHESGGYLFAPLRPRARPRRASAGRAAPPRPPSSRPAGPPRSRRCARGRRPPSRSRRAGTCASARRRPAPRRGRTWRSRRP